MTMTPIIEITDLGIQFGDKWVQQHLNLTVIKGEVLGIVGGSGSGKTTLLREMLGLTKPTYGTIKLFSQDITTATSLELLAIEKRFGVLFQSNALFSSLTLLDNVAFPLEEHTDIPADLITDLALLKISLAGLPLDAAAKYPSELSGGMLRRAGLARALALDPELLFLDEPTAGLDPISAAAFDQLILDLQSSMGLTIVMVTHDLDSLWRVTDRVAFLAEKKVLTVEPIADLVKNTHPDIQAFFNGPRGRVAGETYQSGNIDHG